METRSTGTSCWPLPFRTAKLREQQIGQVERSVAKKMDDYVGPLLSQGLPVPKMLRLGSPRHEIIEVAHEVDADLLVIGSHSKRGLLDIALGARPGTSASTFPARP